MRVMVARCRASGATPPGRVVYYGMPTPERWHPTPPSPEELQEFAERCDRIESEAPGWEADLAAWNARAGHTYELRDFQTYYQSEEQDEFVLRALTPVAAFDPDATFAELVAAMVAVERHAEVPPPAPGPVQYWLQLLECNLPGAQVHDLVFWPNEWFGDPAGDPGAYPMTAEQRTRYAVARSGRALPDCPTAPPLPYPLPG